MDRERTCIMSKIEEIIAESKLSDILNKKEAEKQKNTVVWVLAIIGAVASIQKLVGLIHVNQLL